MRVIVYHAGYGCDSGCCGHYVELEKDDLTTEREFEFDHPWDEDRLEFAKRLIEESFGLEHVKDLDWENSEVSDG